MSDNTKTQQVHLSYELLLFLQWLLQHEEHTLTPLIQQALTQGLADQISEPLSRAERRQVTAELQDTVVDFLLSLQDALHHQYTGVDRTINHQAVPAIIQLDRHALADQDVDASIYQAELALSTGHSSAMAKSAMCKEILKRWKPSGHLQSN
jgi:hypothetical protein